MHPVAPDVVVRQLQWRYATKKFDATRKIPAADWDALEQALVLAPSSYGLQPWKFVVVTNPAVRERLLGASWKQQQVVQASHVVVFAIKKNLGAADVEKYVHRIASVRGIPAASLDGYQQMMTKFVSQPRDKFDVDAWASLQIYIAIGQFMAAAAMMGIDTCPMEGIVPAEYDEILGLAAMGLATSVVCCAGYRAADDRYGEAKKVRFERGDVVLHV